MASLRNPKQLSKSGFWPDFEILGDECAHIDWKNGFFKTFGKFFLGKGAKKMRQKYGLLPNLPRTPPPPPRFGLFCGKKLTPIFLLENASVIAETNFTFGPMFKTNLFPL